MSGSHFTCEDGSILTRACRKSSPVAFALHLSIDGSATYSGIGETLSVTPLLGGRMKRWLLAGTLALAAGGQGLASDLPPPAAPPPPPRAPRRLTCPRWSRPITGAGSISASIWAKALAPANGPIRMSRPDRPAISKPRASWLGLRWASTSRLTRLSMALRAILMGLGSTARLPASFAPIRARPRATGTRRCAPGSAMPPIGYCFMALPAARSATSRLVSVAAACSVGIEAAFTENLTARVEYLFVDLSTKAGWTAGAGPASTFLPA
jgi:hypothetical protein